MKHFFDKLFFYFFTIALILFLYLYLFDKDRYDSILDYIFTSPRTSTSFGTNKEPTRERDYDLLFYSYLFFYFAYFIVMPYCRQTVYAIAQKFYKNYDQKRLYDLGHAFIPYHKYSKYISEYVISFISITILIFFIFNPNIQLLYSLLFIYSILTILKGCFFNLTLLPDSSQECTYSKYFGSCNDLFFSGHVAKILVLLLLCDHYDLIPDYISYIYYLLFAILIVFIISARNHYTIYIFVGMIIGFLVYALYFQKIHI